MEERPPRRRSDMELEPPTVSNQATYSVKTIILPWSIVILLHLSFAKRCSEDYFLGVGMVPKSANNDEFFSSSVISVRDGSKEMEIELSFI